MENEEKQSVTGRRNALKILGLSSAGVFAGNIGEMSPLFAGEVQKQSKGLPPLKIKNVKAIGTRPGNRGSNLVVIKVETSEPGLYGLGCATFTQRALAVVEAANEYLPDLCIGRDAENIEDMWRVGYYSSYWRNGPVLNNALSGLCDALWDIKAKRANMPLYQLLGGKSRFAVDCYAHASGRTPEETADRAQQFIEEGYRHVRIQQGGYGGVGTLGGNPDFQDADFGMPGDGFMDQGAYIRSVPRLFEVVRKRCGEEVELLHDVHERIEPRDAINMCRALEQYHPFFIEDPMSPENTHWWKHFRESTSVPISMGELFNNVNEYLEPMSNRLFDFIRCHVSQIGGITQAMKIAHLGELHNIKTAWHGPGDTSPVGHAANAHMELVHWNFGIHEGGRHLEDELLREVFPGSPTMKNGYMHVNEAPGHGVDLNEKLAAKYPATNNAGRWTVRKYDGTIISP
ncbi:MAG: enolase C-terminal domain-like protein [Bacteroidales bacterium]